MASSEYVTWQCMDCRYSGVRHLHNQSDDSERTAAAASVSWIDCMSTSVSRKTRKQEDEYWLVNISQTVSILSISFLLSQKMYLKLKRFVWQT